VEQRIHSVAYLGEAHLWAGELVGALSCGQEALELSRICNVESRLGSCGVPGRGRASGSNPAKTVEIPYEVQLLIFAVETASASNSKQAA
jgi:hypothetical protein